MRLTNYFLGMVRAMNQNNQDTGRLTSYKRRELGASQVGSIVLGHGFKTPNEILQDAVKEYNDIVEPDTLINNKKVIAGRALEGAIAGMFMDELKRISSADIGMIQHDEAFIHELPNGHLGASLDRMLSIEGAPLEITDQNGKAFSLAGLGPVEIKNYSGSPSDPLYPQYEYQLQAQMICSDTDWGIVVRLCNGYDLQYFVYQKDQKMCDEIIESATDFWNRFDGVIENKDFWYEPANTREASTVHKGNHVKEVVDMNDDYELYKLAEEYGNFKKMEAMAKQGKDETSLAIKNILKEKEVVSCKQFVIRHTTSRRQKTKMIKVPEEFTETRVFSIKEIKQND